MILSLDMNTTDEREILKPFVRSRYYLLDSRRADHLLIPWFVRQCNRSRAGS